MTPPQEHLLTRTATMERSSSAQSRLIKFLVHGSSSSSPTENAMMVECDLPEKDLKRKRSSRSVGPNNTKRPVPRREEEEKDDAGISTKLTLLHEWPFEKKLKASDVDHSSRLLLTRSFVDDHVLKEKDKEMVGLVKSRAGMEIPVWDADTRSKHHLLFGYWESTKGYVLKGSWIQQFVKRRGLVVGDEIGMSWDERERMFLFKVFHKVAQGTSNEVA